MEKQMVDYHIHTDFSDGEPDYKSAIDYAVAIGMEAIAITDHYDLDDSSLRNRFITETDLEVHFINIKEYAEGKKIKVYCGIESCTDSLGKLKISEQVRELCDIIITSPHYLDYNSKVMQGDYFNKDYWNAYKKLLLHMAAGKGDVLGHPEGYLPIGIFGTAGTTYESRQQICREISERYFNMDFIDELGEQLLRSNKAYELHCATATPREAVIQQLAGKGVRFSVGSDAHTINSIGKTDWAYHMKLKYSLEIFQPKECS
jgi:putative hydrolase